MFTRYSKRFLLLALIITASGAAPCQRSLAVVIPQDFNLPIPSSGDQGRMDDAVINVAEHVLIEDLDITVKLTHDAFYDLEIILQSPGLDGKSITLNPSSNGAFIIPGPGGSHSAGGPNRFFFDDEATIDIEHAEPPFDQRFKPAIGYELSVFDGLYAFGDWKIQINDVWAAHSGQLEKVELIINVPEPSSACLFALTAVVVRLLKPRKILQ
jgi:subtilisin-like proprotein convertase family protein